VFGGVVLSLVDRCRGGRDPPCLEAVLTVSVDKVDFKEPITWASS